MCIHILCATIPSLQVFLASAQTGLLDLGAAASSNPNGTYYGYGSAAARSSTHQPGGGNLGGTNRGASTRLRKKEPNERQEEEEEEEIELTRLHGGGTALASVSSCGAKRDNVSISSDDSGMAIRVKQTVDLHFSK
jgi:hypothetical protein